MSKYSILIYKANQCRLNAITSESDWARAYWMEVANKLETMAANLPICKAYHD